MRDSKNYLATEGWRRQELFGNGSSVTAGTSNDRTIWSLTRISADELLFLKRRGLSNYNRCVGCSRQVDEAAAFVISETQSVDKGMADPRVRATPLPLAA